MNFSKIILVIFTLNFSINAFSADCLFTVFHKAKYGSEGSVKDMIMGKCKLGYMSCETMDEGFVTINPKLLTLTHTVQNISEKQCEEKALKACQYTKNDDLLNKRVAIRYSGKALNAYQCGVNNSFKAAFSEKLKGQVESEQYAGETQSNPNPRFIKTKTGTKN